MDNVSHALDELLSISRFYNNLWVEVVQYLSVNLQNSMCKNWGKHWRTFSWIILFYKCDEWSKLAVDFLFDLWPQESVRSKLRVQRLSCRTNKTWDWRRWRSLRLKRTGLLIIPAQRVVISNSDPCREAAFLWHHRCDVRATGFLTAGELHADLVKSSSLVAFLFFTWTVMIDQCFCWFSCFCAKCVSLSVMSSVFQSHCVFSHQCPAAFQ